MNWKGFGRKRSYPIPGINPVPLDIIFVVYIVAKMTIHTIHVVTDFAYTIH
jgi:hypothetical protein